MENVDNYLQAREAWAQTEGEIIGALQQLGIDAKVQSVGIVRLDPKEHSYEIIDEDWRRAVENERVVKCFSFAGFEDVYTGFILMCPVTEISHQGGCSDCEGNSFWFVCINQFGLPLVPEELRSLTCSTNEKVEGEVLEEAISQLLPECEALFMQMVAYSAQWVVNAGREGYIKAINRFLAKNGKPPVVVL